MGIIVKVMSLVWQRSFCAKVSTGQKPSAPGAKLSLVLFYNQDPHRSCLVRRTGWTRDINVFFKWLSAIPFDCGLSYVAIAEGLAEALMIFYPEGNQTQQNVEGQRHCILVAATNPCPWPTPVYLPELQNAEQGDNMESPTDSHLSDAEGVAKSFAQCSISLSVICPWQLPKLKAIYNAGKRNAQAMDLPVDNLKNEFLVLISENFMEARAALSRSGIANTSTQSPMKVDAASVPSICGLPSTSIQSAEGAVINCQSVSVGSIPRATVEIEPTTVTSMVGPTFPQTPSVPLAAWQAIPDMQTSSPIWAISSSQDIISTNGNVQEPIVTGMAQPLRPVGGAVANVRTLNDVAHAMGALAGGTSIGFPSMGGTPMLSNMISSGMTSSVPIGQTILFSGQSGVASVAGSVPLAGNAQDAHSSAPMSFPSTISNLSGSSKISMLQPLSNLQGSVSMGQTVPSMSQGSSTGTQMIEGNWHEPEHDEWLWGIH